MSNITQFYDDWNRNFTVSAIQHVLQTKSIVSLTSPQWHAQIFQDIIGLTIFHHYISKYVPQLPENLPEKTKYILNDIIKSAIIMFFTSLFSFPQQIFTKQWFNNFLLSSLAIIVYHLVIRDELIKIIDCRSYINNVFAEDICMNSIIFAFNKPSPLTLKLVLNEIIYKFIAIALYHHFIKQKLKLKN